MSTRIEGIIDRLTDAESFDDIKWILGDGVVTNYAESIIDDHLKANVDFQGKAGLAVTVERVMTGKDPCDFCIKRAGRYTYPDVPDNLWERHVDCHCYINYDNGSFRQVLGGKDKKWEILSEEASDQRRTFGLTTPTKRELNARAIVGMAAEDKEAVETRKAIGMGEVKATDPAQLKKTGNGSVTYMYKEESAHFFTEQKNAAEAITDRFGGDIKYLESVSDPSKLNWNGESWHIVQGQDFTGALKYHADDMDGVVYDVTGTGIPEKTIKKKMESALNAAGITKELDVIVVRDGKVISTLHFGR